MSTMKVYMRRLERKIIMYSGFVKYNPEYSKNENNVSANHHLNSFLLKLVILFLSFMCILKCESKADEVSHMNDKIVCKVYEYIQVNQQGFKVARSCVQIYINDILLGGGFPL